MVVVVVVVVVDAGSTNERKTSFGTSLQVLPDHRCMTQRLLCRFAKYLFRNPVQHDKYPY